MKKIKGWIKTHWFATLVISISAILVILSAYYALDFAKDAKEISDKRAIYQLGVTAIAASVGIGTILNSTRSASIAAESMKLTKDKELREQSSHLVASSQLSSSKMSPPMYKDTHIYSPAKYLAQPLTDVIYPPQQTLESYNESVVNFKKSLMSIQAEQINEESKLNTLHLLNIGKGVCLNLEYNFKFMNKDEFDNYSVQYDTDKQGEYDVVAPATYPSYDLFVEQNKEYLRVIIVDHTISYLADQVLLESNEIEHYSTLHVSFVYLDQTTHIPFLEPGKDVHLPIPNEFMVLCKHYLIMSSYKKQESKLPISKYVKASIQHLIEGKAISPLGEIRISYMDEEDVRARNKDPIRKELVFRVNIKDASIYRNGDDIHFYLEFTPISKEPQKTKKKRAYGK
ncbi:hypothetical protein [Exiguobacterium sp. s78]|uniref:hypothetical protein n=1 Tax=Exiguobacterium sp. s78 TaxID=2751197 RepID=UPI001BE5B5BE|nr:hypothetical protein [Exiguobacterium sp. s78]